MPFSNEMHQDEDDKYCKEEILGRHRVLDYALSFNGELTSFFSIIQLNLSNYLRGNIFNEHSETCKIVSYQNLIQKQNCVRRFGISRRTVSNETPGRKNVTNKCELAASVVRDSLDLRYQSTFFALDVTARGVFPHLTGRIHYYKKFKTSFIAYSTLQLWIDDENVGSSPPHDSTY